MLEVSVNAEGNLFCADLAEAVSHLFVTDVVDLTNIDYNPIFYSDVMRTAWIAAFFDAEGCVHITTDGKLQLWITNTNLDAVKLAQSMTNGTIQERKGTNKKIYRLFLTGHKAVDFLKKILPFSIVKREQIYYAIEYYEQGNKEDIDKYRKLVNSRLRGD